MREQRFEIDNMVTGGVCCWVYGAANVGHVGRRTTARSRHFWLEYDDDDEEGMVEIGNDSEIRWLRFYRPTRSVGA